MPFPQRMCERGEHGDHRAASVAGRGPQARRPDLLVQYRAVVTPRLQVTATQPVRNADPIAYGSCSFDCADRVTEYEAATLVIDIVDARSRKIVWRGWARDDFDAMADDQDRMARHLQQAVAEMMAKLPAGARECALSQISRDVHDTDDWRGWNLGRVEARKIVPEPVSARQFPCYRTYR